MVGYINAMTSRYHCIIDSKSDSAYFQKSNPFVFFVNFSIKINKKIGALSLKKMFQNSQI